MMEHIESTTKVFYTKEYKRFNLINGNRQLNETKIKKIINDITNGTDMLRYCPVLVVEKNDRLNVVDGQHRFWVSKKLKCPVWYTITEDLTLYDIAKLNSNTEKWIGKDFINCYTQLGNSDYKILQALLDQYKIPLTTAISLLQSGKVNDGGGTKNRFERGEFKVSHESLTREVLDICGQFNYSHKFSRGFIKAVIKIKEKGVADLQEIIAKVNERPGDMPVFGEYKEFVTALETVYNNGKRNRVTIY